MAIHAAMIDRVDQEIGRVLKQLHDMQAFENTLIFFLSDNGASAEIMVRSDGHDPAAPRGSAASYLCLGPGWSTTCNTPFRRHKTWVHEGGISTPLVVHWPGRVKDPGAFRTNPGHVVDIVPTILAACDVQPLTDWSGKSIPTKPGVNLLPAIEQNQPVDHDYLWWLHEGNRAIRMGDWKLVAADGEPWELYNLLADRSEQNNLASSQPDRVRTMESKWNQITEEFRQLKQQE